MKIVINECYGGFGVSEEFLDTYNIPYKPFLPNIPDVANVESFRTDTRLIEFIEKFGSERASSDISKLVVHEIPKGTLYRINEYDSYETIEYQQEVNWNIAV